MMKLLAIPIMALLFALSAIVAVPASAQFDPLDCFDENGVIKPEYRNSDLCKEAQKPRDPGGDGGIFLTAGNLLALVGGIIAVIIIIVAGIQMIFSQGDANSVKNSRNAIIYASIGLVVIALARTIVLFIATRFD